MFGSAATTRHDVGPFVAGARYRYRVAAMRGLRIGDWSQPAEATWKAAPDPDEEEGEPGFAAQKKGGNSVEQTEPETAQSNHDTDVATLSALSLDGIDIGAFDSENVIYTAVADSADDHTTVTATPTASGASVTITPR